MGIRINFRHDVILTLAVILLSSNLGDCNSPPSRNRTFSSSPTSRAATNRTSFPGNVTARAIDSHIQATYVLDPSEQFCRNIQGRPFYQRISDGTVCCRGHRLPLVTIVPETTGECAISTKTSAEGLLDTEGLWCSYTCSLKKLGAIDKDGRVVPEKFLAHLSDGLTEASKNRVRNVMTNSLDCFKPLKNSQSACHTPLSFQKCFIDALYWLCVHGVPKKEDISKIKALGLDYEKLVPACVYNRKTPSPACCHGNPMPWSAMEIMEAPSPLEETKATECLKNMGLQCDATCYLNSIGAVNAEMELDVGVFESKVLKHFPTVKASRWMDYLGPVFLFFDESLADMGDESSDTPHRVCRFHDRIMELHESKVDQYCSMTKEEIKELIKSNQARR